MLYGLSGASGTGKTTLGRMVAAELGIEFVETSITQLARDVGFEALDKLPLQKRLDLQYGMLNRFMDKLTKINGHAILDRTPVDMIGYMLGEVTMHSSKSVKPIVNETIAKYVGHCQLATRKYFDHVFLTSILPSYDEVDTRPKYDPAYQRAVQLLITGAVFEDHLLPATRIVTTDLNRRVVIVRDAINERIAIVDAERKTSRKLH